MAKQVADGAICFGGKAAFFRNASGTKRFHPIATGLTHKLDIGQPERP